MSIPPPIPGEPDAAPAGIGEAPAGVSAPDEEVVGADPWLLTAVLVEPQATTASSDAAAVAAVAAVGMRRPDQGGAFTPGRRRRRAG